MRVVQVHLGQKLRFCLLLIMSPRYGALLGWGQLRDNAPLHSTSSIVLRADHRRCPGDRIVAGNAGSSSGG